ncbi:Rne/Rng family ribonuclease [Alloscardovia omnicolens]|uniref:Rne/Rng family ribonuclease n=1 Tax=Alloscardovia omnicolens TaxID=419015 RepID=UPI003A65F2A2
MSDHVNQEPPVLGRRTNKGLRRVVRVTGAQDSQVTQIEQAEPSEPTHNNEEHNQVRHHAHTERSAAHDTDTSISAEQVSESTDKPEQREQSTQTEQVEDNHQDSHQEFSDQQTSMAVTGYRRSADAQRIARTLFVDEGIDLPDEQIQTELAQTVHSADESATQDSAERTVENVTESEQPRIRRRSASSRDVHQLDDSHTSVTATDAVAPTAAAAAAEPDTSRRPQQRSNRRRLSDDKQFSAPATRETSTTVERSKEDQDTSQTRSQRARAAVSQILEFSSSETNHEDARVAEHFNTPANPMMSLLFQAPVLPEISQTSQAHEDREDKQEQSSRRNRRNRREKGQENTEVLDNIAQALDETERSRSSRVAEQSEDEETSRRSRRRNRKDKNDTNQRDNAQDNERNSAAISDEFENDGRNRRNRRLNAQERRAAAEVELIESDLELDDIDYEPIEGDAYDEQSSGQSRTSRDDDTQQGARRSRVRSAMLQEDDNEEEFTTRRRRRRRSSKAADEEVTDNTSSDSDSSTANDDTRVRSRKQQYIDEITDVAGSTRLEAKRQRRRDNRRDRNRQTALITEQDFLARREVVNRLMVVRERGSHTQVSVIEDDVLVEHYISDIAEVSAVGNIYQGRVQNVLPSMEAAFVDIGQARNGVLYAGEVNWDTTRLDGQPRRMEHAFKSGDPVLVQVTKDPIGHKGARLTSQITLAGRFLVLVPSGSMTGVSRKLPERERARLKSIVAKVAPEEVGVIIRTAAEGASEEAIIKDFEHLKNQWDHISHRLEELKNSRKPHLLQGEPDVVIRVIRDIFNDDFKKLVVEGENVYNRIREYIESAAPDLLDRVERWDPAEHRGKDVFDRWQIDSQLRKGMERQVYLPSGGSLVIDRTEAMTTIDVNTGRFIGKGKSLEETVTRCNLEAAEEVVRQLRLRDIGGMVMIDFVDMVMPANRDLVLRRLVECLSRDRTKHQVAEVTSLGLVQMTRKRVGQGLVEAFSEECPTCGGRGFILHDEPTVSSQYDDPYALKGGDPFVKTNKHGFSAAHTAHAPAKSRDDAPAREEMPGTSEKAKSSMAAIAAASAHSANSANSGVKAGEQSGQTTQTASGVQSSQSSQSVESAQSVQPSETDNDDSAAAPREASTTLALISQDLKTLQESRGHQAARNASHDARKEEQDQPQQDEQ